MQWSDVDAGLEREESSLSVNEDYYPSYECLAWKFIIDKLFERRLLSEVAICFDKL